MTAELLQKISIGRKANWVDISADGNLVAIGGDDDRLSLWKPDEPGSIRHVPFSNGVCAVAVSWDGTRVAASMTYRGCFVQVWNTETIAIADNISTQGPDRESPQSPEYTITKKHRDLVAKLSFSPDGKWLATAGYEPEVGLWQAETGKSTQFWKHQDRVNDLCFSPDAKLLTYGIGSREGRLVIQTIKSLKEKLNTNTGRKGAVRCVTFAADSKSVFGGCSDGTLRGWKITRKTHLFAESYSKVIRQIAIDPDGNLLVGMPNGDVVICDCESGKEVARWKAHSSGITSMKCSGSTLVVASDQGDVGVWQV